MQGITEALISIAIALIAAIPGILALRQNRKRQEAEVAAFITKASGDLIAQYEKRMKEMEESAAKTALAMSSINDEVSALHSSIKKRDNDVLCRDQYIEHLLNGIKRLIAQLVSMNVIPVWQPEDPKEFYLSSDEEVEKESGDI